MLACSTRWFPRAWLLLAGPVALSTSLAACSLIGVEPDEIDLAVEESGDAGAEASSADGSDSGADEGISTTGMNSGDGDGDPTGTGDGDGAPGDGDTGGDGDPADLQPCDNFATALVPGPNPVSISAGPSLSSGTCGNDGPEAVFSYTSDADAGLELSLTGFEAALYLVDGDICLPLSAIDCVNTPMTLSASIAAGETLYFVVDALDGNGGSGELSLVTTP